MKANAYIHIYVCVYIYTYTHVYIYTYIYIHTPNSSSSGSELSSIGDIGSEGKRNTHAQRHNVIITDVMLLDLVGSARREIYDPAEAGDLG